jgi:arginase family enzyme
MAEAAALELPYPEAAIVAEDTLGDQHLVLASELPERPLVIGGCCCSHVGTVEGLVARHDRLALIWIDAHGDLNTPETSPSGNEWGMPLRMIVDAGVTVVGAGLSGLIPDPRNLPAAARLTAALGL